MFLQENTSQEVLKVIEDLLLTETPMNNGFLLSCSSFHKFTMLVCVFGYEKLQQ